MLSGAVGGTFSTEVNGSSEAWGDLGATHSFNTGPLGPGSKSQISGYFELWKSVKEGKIRVPSGEFKSMDWLRGVKDRCIAAKEYRAAWEEGRGRGPFLNYVKDCFGKYKETIQGVRSYILGLIVGGEHDGKITAFETFNRFQVEYKKELDSRFGALYRAQREKIQKIMVKWVVRGVEYEDEVDLGKSAFLTLTVDPKKVGIYEAWLDIPKWFNAFITHLKRAMKKKLHYIWTLEAQPGTGYPHLHILFIGVDWLLLNGTWEDYKRVKARNDDIQTISSLWKHGLTFVNRREDGARIGTPMNYMFKCIRDTWAHHKDSGELTAHQREILEKGDKTRMMLWFFSRKAYGASMGLRSWLNANRVVTDVSGEDHPVSTIRWLGMVVTRDMDKIMGPEELTPFMPKGWREKYGKGPPG